MNTNTSLNTKNCHKTSRNVLAWWTRRDDMGGFRTAARELFPGWDARPGCCLAPHRAELLPKFSVCSSRTNTWYFKDRVTGQIGGLAAFVMLAGLDADAASQWLTDRWLAESGESAVANGAPEMAASVSINSSQPHESHTTNGSHASAAHVIYPQPPAPPGQPDATPWGLTLGAAIVTSGELQTMALPARPKLLGDWFCEGDLGFIYAFRGVGKTWLAMLMARALSEGGRLGEWQAPAPARVLYIDGEMPPDLMRQRDRGLARAGGDGLEFLNHEILFRRTHRVMNITLPEVQLAILERCVATGVKVLILDNLSTLASGMKENDADDWEMVGRWLLDFRRRQIAVVVIHHAGRNGEMRGTTKREDDAGWIIALDDARQAADDRRGARFITRFSKQTRNTPEEIPPFEWHIEPASESGLITVTHQAAHGTNILRRLIEEGITECSELAEELKVSKGTVSKWAHKGINEGWLVKEGRCYALRA